MAPFTPLVPLGSEVVMTCNALLMLTENCRFVLKPFPSMTCAVKLKTPLLVGVPVKSPLLNNDSFGNVPPVCDQLKLPLQLDACRNWL